MIRGWCSSTPQKEKRIAKRKIDGERWLDDCVVLFLVRKQYLTIPFGDLNSYNGRQEEKEGGKSGQNVLLDELTNPRMDWIISFLHESFFTLLYEFFFRIFCVELLTDWSAYVFLIKVWIYLFSVPNFYLISLEERFAVRKIE